MPFEIEFERILFLLVIRAHHAWDFPRVRETLKYYAIYRRARTQFPGFSLQIGIFENLRNPSFLKLFLIRELIKID